MPDPIPTLHMICGKIAAGKSTLAQDLAGQAATVLIGEDQWLSTLYPDEITSLEDYVRCSGRLRAVMGPHVETLLRAGLSVVLDVPANTRRTRLWMRGLFEAANSAHRLHHLDVPDALCKERLAARNRSGAHAFAPSEADYDLFTKFFEAPAPEEGFDVTVYSE